jgi:hypothetical protein
MNGGSLTLLVHLESIRTWFLFSHWLRTLKWLTLMDKMAWYPNQLAIPMVRLVSIPMESKSILSAQWDNAPAEIKATAALYPSLLFQEAQVKKLRRISRIKTWKSPMR